MFIARSGCFTRLGSAEPLGQARAFRSQAREQNDEESRLLPAPGPCGHVGVRLEATRSFRAAARCRGTRGKAVGVIPSPIRAVRISVFVWGVALNVSRNRVSAVCRRRAALRVIHMPVSSRALGSPQGSFERRYNHRLHQTAPREHRSHAGHGQPLVSPARSGRSGLVTVGYTAGTSVPRTVLSVARLTAA